MKLQALAVSLNYIYDLSGWFVYLTSTVILSQDHPPVVLVENETSLQNELELEPEEEVTGSQPNESGALLSSVSSN